MGKLFHRLLSALNMLASVWILVLVALISADVVGRGAFNAPLQGIPEIAKFSIIAMFWLQMAYVLRIGGHLRTTLGFDFLPTSGKKAVLLANNLVGLVLFLLVVWLGMPEMLKTWRMGVYEGSDAARIPLWPFWGILVLGALLTSVQFLLDLVSVLRGDARELAAVEAPRTVAE